MISLRLLLTVALISATIFSGQGNEQFTQVLADNEKLVREYTYKQRTEVKYNGEEKVVRISQVRFEANGKREVVPTDDPENDTTSEKLPKGPLRHAKAKAQQDKLRDYAERLAQLFEGYLPVNPQKLRSSFSAAQNEAQANDVALTFTNYLKSGDRIVLFLDSGTRKLKRIEITSSLDDDAVTGLAQMASAPNGARYPSRTEIKSPSKKLEIVRTEYDFVRR